MLALNLVKILNSWNRGSAKSLNDMTLDLYALQYVIHLQLRPLVNLSDGVDVFLGLEKPYLCCPPQMTIQHLCKVRPSGLTMRSALGWNLLTVFCNVSNCN